MKISAGFLVGLGWILVSTLTAFSAQVTFQVNMSAQTALGNFNPASDTVVVAGDAINSWSTSDSPLAPSTTNTNVWTGTFDVAGTTGSTVQYKFVMNTAGGLVWEGNVGTGGGTANRTFTLPETDLALPVVFFNNVTNTTLVNTPVTFQVNLSLQMAQGNFDPSSGTVSVAGEFNNWSASASPLMRSLTDSNVWTDTLTLTGAVGTVVSYKYVLNGSTWEGNVGTNGAQNRSLTLARTAQTLPVVFFNNQAAVPSSIPVTFQVDLAVPLAQGNFDPTTGTVSVAGDVLNNWNTTASMLTPSTTESNLWTGTFTITGSPGMAILYKYVLNGSTWESINNRTYTLSSTNAQTLPRVFFNDVGNLGPLVLGAKAGGQLGLSWTAGPLIRLQTATGLNAPAWTDVPNTQGQSTGTVRIASGPAFFRLAAP